MVKTPMRFESRKRGTNSNIGFNKESCDDVEVEKIENCEKMIESCLIWGKIS